MVYNWTPRLLLFIPRELKKPKQQTTLTAIQWDTSFTCQPLTQKSVYIYWSACSVSLHTQQSKNTSDLQQTDLL